LHKVDQFKQMESFSSRPEKMGASSLVLREGVPYDLTGFR